ncbi:uncharacterized protein NKAPD1-like [Amphiura filiformis]|uniref:uncharacterized protein NKAPD1-like n=1 Tax=Amphiura filiformis TaxID=82378 RepID=UPI003B22677C
MASSVRYLDRKLLRNVLRHTEVHNRLREEKDMWKQRRDPRDPRDSRNRSRYSDSGGRGKMRSDTMDDEVDRLTNKIVKHVYSNKNPEKWGHNGFKELYPDEFIDKSSTEETSSDEEDARRKGKKRKKKKKAQKARFRQQ